MQRYWKIKGRDGWLRTGSRGFFYFTILLRASSVCCFSKGLHPAIQEKIMWKMKTIFHIIMFYWTKIQWALRILGFASADSTDLGSKIFEKKFRKFPKAKLQFAACIHLFTEHFTLYLQLQADLILWRFPDITHFTSWRFVATLCRVSIGATLPTALAPFMSSSHFGNSQNISNF